ncbi:MAG: SDR family oxidoreductase [Actinomycetota bacterium]|nr:SDR family oxidoreductase [Actinomycetota bacterium]
MDLVTGATGHLGNVLVRELLAAGKKVRVLLRPESKHQCLDNLELEKFYGDITSLDSVISACRNVENVYHTAAEISIMPGRSQRLSMVNLQGTKNIIEACRINQVKRLLYTSSIHALAETTAGIVIDENTCFDPHNPRGAYDRTKAAASLEVLKASGNGLEAMVLCPTAFIGPYDYKISFLGQFFLDYAKGNYRFMLNGAYDCVDVRDVARGHISAAALGRPGQVYLLSGHWVDMKQMTQMLETITGIKPPRFWLGKGLAGIISYLSTLYHFLSRSKPQFTRYSWCTINSNFQISNQKARKELNYYPRPLADSLKDTVSWYLSLTGPYPEAP